MKDMIGYSFTIVLLREYRTVRYRTEKSTISIVLFMQSLHMEMFISKSYHL